MWIHALVLFIVRWQWYTKEIGYIKLQIVMRKHAKHSMHMWIVSRRHKKSFLCACKSLYFLFIYYFLQYIRDSVCCHFEKINEKKKPEKIKIFTDYYYIPNIKLKIMLYEPVMLNMVWKSTERFGNLSLEKYGILKWKMCRNPAVIWLLGRQS